MELLESGELLFEVAAVLFEGFGLIRECCAQLSGELQVGILRRQQSQQRRPDWSMTRTKRIRKKQRQRRQLYWPLTCDAGNGW